MVVRRQGRSWPVGAGAAGLCFALAGCADDAPPVHGKVVLCPTTASYGPASIVVANADQDRPAVRTVARDTLASGICAAVGEAATEAGYKIAIDDPGQAAVRIMSDDPDSIQIDVKNVRVLIQQF